MFFGLVISMSVSTSFVSESRMPESDGLIKETTESTIHLSVFEKAVSLLITLLDASGHCHFFRSLELKEFLAWLELLYVNFEQQVIICNVGVYLYLYCGR